MVEEKERGVAIVTVLMVESGLAAQPLSQELPVPNHHITGIEISSAEAQKDTTNVTEAIARRVTEMGHRRRMPEGRARWPAIVHIWHHRQ